MLSSEWLGSWSSKASVPLAICRREGHTEERSLSRTNFLRYAGTTLSLLGCHQEGFMILWTCVEKETQIIRYLRGEANPVQTYPNLFSWKKMTTVNICTGLMTGAPLRATSSSVLLCLLYPVGTCSGTLHLQKSLAGLFVLRRKSKQFTQNHRQTLPFCITTLSCNLRSKWKAPQDKMPDPKAWGQFRTFRVSRPVSRMGSSLEGRCFFRNPWHSGMWGEGIEGEMSKDSCCPGKQLTLCPVSPKSSKVYRTPHSSNKQEYHAPPSLQDCLKTLTEEMVEVWLTQERDCGDSPVLWSGLVADLSQRDFKTTLCSHLAGDIQPLLGFVLSACLLLLSWYKNADTHLWCSLWNLKILMCFRTEEACVIYVLLNM